MSVGLLYGIGPWHVRMLCENSWEGGRQYTPAQVGDLTLDEVMMLLTDRKILQGKRFRTSTVEPLEATGRLADKDGVIKGRAADGTPIKGRIAGKSKARQLMEAEAARKEAEKQKQQPQPKRRRGRK